MAATFTSVYGFSKPAKGDVGWWSTVNANFDAIDSALAGIQSQITGLFADGMLSQGRMRLTGGAATFPDVQGMYLSWNKSAGAGEGNFIVNRGGGTGGFAFDVTDNGTVFLRLVTIDQPASETHTSLEVHALVGGTGITRRVLIGALNSGGSGFRQLVVVN